MELNCRMEKLSKQVEKDGYKYLGVLELDRIIESNMKEHFSK